MKAKEKEELRLKALKISQDIEDDMETNTLSDAWSRLTNNEQQDILERYMGYTLNAVGYPGQGGT